MVGIGFCAIDVAFSLTQQRLRIENLTGLDRPYDAASLGTAHAVIRISGVVEKLEILHRIAVNDDEIGNTAFANSTKLLPKAGNFGGIGGGNLDEVEWVEASLLEQLTLSDNAEAVKRLQ